MQRGWRTLVVLLAAVAFVACDGDSDDRTAKQLARRACLSWTTIGDGGHERGLELARLAADKSTGYDTTYDDLALYMRRFIREEPIAEATGNLNTYFNARDYIDEQCAAILRIAQGS